MQALSDAISSEDRRQPRFAHEVRGFVDQRFGDRGEDEHRGQRYLRRPRRAEGLAAPERYRPSRMRVWIDLTNSPHVLVMRPLIERLQADGHEVRVTARDFAQTLELCDRLEIDHTAIGHHRGGRLAAKAGGLASRSTALVRWARRRRARAAGGRFDIALGHGSNDVTVAAALLRIPSSTMFDYEWATVQHNVNCRLARAVVVPDAIPPERLARYGARGKLRSYEGLKEEYYLADFEPEHGRAGRARARSRRARSWSCARLPRSRSTTASRTTCSPACCERLRAAAREGVQPVVLPRVDSQREELRASRRLRRARATRSTPSR